MLKPLSLFLALCIFFLGAAAAEDAENPAPNYLELKPSLVANLATGGKYIRCDVQLMTTNRDLIEEIEHHAPVIRHELLMLLADQDGANLKTPEGKEALRGRAIEAVRKTLRELTGEDGIDDLYFTAFFVQ